MHFTGTKYSPYSVVVKTQRCLACMETSYLCRVKFRSMLPKLIIFEVLNEFNVAGLFRSLFLHFHHIYFLAIKCHIEGLKVNLKALNKAYFQHVQYNKSKIKDYNIFSENCNIQNYNLFYL